MMRLQDALDKSAQLTDDVIFARRPWTLESDAEIAALDKDYRVPTAIATRGLEYFLEAPVIREVLEVFGDREPTQAEQRALLLYYVEHDAYPDWVCQ